MDMARCLLDEVQFDKKYWPEIIIAAAYLKNRVLTNTIEKKTPYETPKLHMSNFKNVAFLLLSK